MPTKDVLEIPNSSNDDEGDNFEEDGGDEFHEEENDAGEECGRWRNGRLDDHCLKAGSEECEFECPYNQ